MADLNTDFTAESEMFTSEEIALGHRLMASLEGTDGFTATRAVLYVLMSVVGSVHTSPLSQTDVTAYEDGVKADLGEVAKIIGCIRIAPTN